MRVEADFARRVVSRPAATIALACALVLAGFACPADAAATAASAGHAPSASVAGAALAAAATGAPNAPAPRGDGARALRRARPPLRRTRPAPEGLGSPVGS